MQLAPLAQLRPLTGAGLGAGPTRSPGAGEGDGAGAAPATIVVMGAAAEDGDPGGDRGKRGSCNGGRHNHSSLKVGSDLGPVVPAPFRAFPRAHKLVLHCGGFTHPSVWEHGLEVRS